MTQGVGFSIEQCPLDPQARLSLDAASLLIRFGDDNPPVADAYIADLNRNTKLIAAVEEQSEVVIGAATCVPCLPAPGDYSDVRPLDALRNRPPIQRWQHEDPITQIFDLAVLAPGREELAVARALVVRIATIAMSHDNMAVLSGAHGPAADMFRQLGFAGEDNDLFAIPQKLLSAPER